jgi:hypothetical protein
MKLVVNIASPTNIYMQPTPRLDSINGAQGIITENGAEIITENAQEIVPG